MNGCSATYLFRYSKVYYVYCRNNKVYSFNPRARKPSKSNTSIRWVGERAGTGNK